MANVHGIMEAHRNDELAAIYAGSSMTLPDGTPTVWVGRWQGHKIMQRVAGPDLMLEVFRHKEFASYTHFLYGGEEHVAEELRERFTRRFPWARIVGTYTPPFRELNAEEEESLIARIRQLKPDIIWVGISTPRQERFMHRYLHRLLQDPRRLWKRYLGTNPAFLWHTALQLSGLRHYPATRIAYLPAPLDSDQAMQADHVVSQRAASGTRLQQLGS